MAVTAGLAAAASPAAAEGDPAGPEPQVLEVSGPFTATGTLVGGPCVFNQVVDGEGDWTGLGASTFHLEFCTEPIGTSVTFSSAGTFSITTAEGTLSGTLAGTVDAGLPGTEFPFDYELVVDDATDGLEGATGTLTLQGAFGLAAATAWGDISGTIELPPPTPSSKDDCKHGGWKNFVDGDGKPFRNQGHCIRYVLHHR